MNTESYINEMSALLSFYAGLPADFNDIDRLLVAKRKLTHYAFYWSTEVGKALELYNSIYAERKTFMSKMVLNEVRGGDSISKATHKAEVESEDMRQNEAKAEALYRQYKGYQDAISQAIQSIMQDISYLKQEKEYSKSES